MFLRESQKLILTEIMLDVMDVEQTLLETNQKIIKRPKELFKEISDANKFFNVAKKQIIV